MAITKFQRGGNMITDNAKLDGYNQTPDLTKHDLSHRKLTTGCIGDLIPCLVEEVLPNDHWKINLHNYTKLQPLVNPIFDNLDTSAHCFYVPNRMIETNWDDFYTGGTDGKFAQPRATFSLFAGATSSAQADPSLKPLFEKSRQLFIGLGDCSQTLDLLGFGHDYDGRGIFTDDGLDECICPRVMIAPLLALKYIQNEYYRHEYLEADRFKVPSEGMLAAVRDYSLKLGKYNHNNFPYGAFLKWITGQDGASHFASLETIVGGSGQSPLYLHSLGEGTTIDVQNLERNSQYCAAGNTDSSFYSHSTNCICVNINNLWYFDTMDYRDVFCDSILWLLINERRMVDAAQGLIEDVSPLIGRHVSYATWPMTRLYSRDYFTNCLPEIQHGVTAYMASMLSGSPSSPSQSVSVPTLSGQYGYKVLQKNSTTPLEGGGNFYSLSTLNDIRQLNAMTRWLEVNARSGGRLYEQTLAHFGIEDKFDRLTRPLYCGGMKGFVQVDQVLNTNGDGVPLGEWGAIGAATSNGEMSLTASEHGLVVVLFSVVPRLSYGGIHRKWLDKFFERTTIFTPEFAHLTEQAVLKSELTPYEFDLNRQKALSGERDAMDSEVFGYIPIYEEYRDIPSSVHGEFLTNQVTYHAARRFFDGQSNTFDFQHVGGENTDRIFNIDQVDLASQLLLEFDFGISAIRAVPKNGNAGYLGNSGAPI